ncbi:hypothetical protein EIN_092430, partial [Entamoeba invadens IP1]
MELAKLYNLSLLILGVLTVLSASGVIFLSIFGPIGKMPNTQKLNNSDLKFYSKTVYMLETISLCVLFIIAGGMMIACSFIQKDWMCLLSYMVIGLGITCAFALGTYYAITYSSFVNTKDNTLKTLSHWEDMFDCCGWVTKRPMPPCASSIGALL